MRHCLISTFGLSLLSVATPAFAQIRESQIDKTAAGTPIDKHSFDVELSVTPTIGTDMPFDGENSYIDDSAASVSAKFVVPMGQYVKLSAAPGLTLSPEFLDDDSPTAGWFAQLQLEANLPLGRNRYAGSSTTDLRDVFTPYVRFRVEQGYKNFLDDYAQTDKIWTLGLAFEDIRRVICRSDEESCKSRFQSGQDIKKGLRYKLTAEMGRIYSDVADRERVTPSVSVKVTAPTRFVLAFYLTGKAEWRRYVSARGLDRKRLYEDRLTGEAGVDFTGAFKLPEEYQLTAGMRYVRNRSNGDKKNWERGFFVPALTVTTRF